MTEIPEYARPKLVKPDKRKKREWRWCIECHTWEVHEHGTCPFCAMIAKAGPDELAEIKRIWPNHFTHRGTFLQALRDAKDPVQYGAILENYVKFK